MKLRLATNLTLSLTDEQLVQEGFRAYLGGESGSGKSFSTAAIIGQVLEQGVQVIVLDAHGEYAPLSVLASNSLLVGYDTKKSTSLSVDMLHEYLHLIEQEKTLFINLKEWADTEPRRLNELVFPLLRGIYQIRKRQPRLTMLVVEEAHLFAAQVKGQGDTEKVKVLVGIATGGRKYGLQLIVCTQRQAMVDKSVLSACNVRVFLRTSDWLDWDVIRKYIPKTLSISYDDKKTGLRHFENGEAIVLTRWSKDKRVKLLRPSVEPTTNMPSILR